MKDFYISEVGATGEDVKHSKIELKRGVNIISGPSDTGKSMILNCIDYLLGANDLPFDPVATKYSGVYMVMTDDKGHEIRIERDINCENDPPKPYSSIHISSSYEDIPDGDYSTGSSSKHKFNEQILKLLGIPEPPQIIQTQEGKPQSLTLRTFLHQFFLEESHIFMEGTIIDNPSHSGITSSLTSLMYLLDEGGTVEKDFESSQVKKAKKKAVQDYISKKFKYIEDRNVELQELIVEAGGDDPESRISEILEEISQIQDSINEANSESRKLAEGILREESALQEARFLQDRYDMLRSQYESDLRRLTFIVDGESKSSKGYADRCPFCSNAISEEEQRESYSTAAEAEAISVRAQLNDLRETQKELDAQIRQREKALDSLNSKKESITKLVEGSFRPQIKQLNETLKRYRRILELQTELQANQAMYQVFDFDYSAEEAKDTTPDKFDAKKKFNEDAFAKLSSTVSSTIKSCGYPGFNKAKLSRSSFDVEVNDFLKKNHGKGYRAFLNSAFAFALMKFLEEYAMHPPKMLILDSPILSLKEVEGAEASTGMKASLFQHIIDNTGDCQVIVVENEIPKEGVEYKNANLIEFTGEEGRGTYGFLASYHQTKDRVE